MRLALFTNIPSHHQIPAGEAFAQRLGTDFSLVCWETGSQERNKLGWSSDYEFDWLLVVGDSESKRQQAMEILCSADVIIWGYAPEAVILERLSAKKLTFQYTERPYKRGRWRLISPRAMLTVRRMRRLDHPAHHLLAVGPHCVSDYRFLRMFRDRMWRWGYFPALPDLDAPREPNPVPVVLWAGRMLDWKQVDLLIDAAKWARDHGAPPFEVKLIGYGPEENRLRALVETYHMSEMIHFFGATEPANVIQAMKEADIYVLPSSKVEGWGAVVNEAMSCECCVIGSKQAGSVPWLIEDGVNGFHFDGKTVKSLGEKLLYCLNNPAHRLEMGRAARRTIEDLWSPAAVANRFLDLCVTLENGAPLPPADNGVCSRA